MLPTGWFELFSYAIPNYNVLGPPLLIINEENALQACLQTYLVGEFSQLRFPLPMTLFGSLIFNLAKSQFQCSMPSVLQYEKPSLECQFQQSLNDFQTFISRQSFLVSRTQASLPFRNVPLSFLFIEAA